MDTQLLKFVVVIITNQVITTKQIRNETEVATDLFFGVVKYIQVKWIIKNIMKGVQTWFYPSVVVLMEADLNANMRSLYERDGI